MTVGVVVPFEDKHPEKNTSIEKLVSLVASDMERVNAMILSRTGSEVTMIPAVVWGLGWIALGVVLLWAARRWIA